MKYKEYVDVYVSVVVGFGDECDDGGGNSARFAVPAVYICALLTHIGSANGTVRNCTAFTDSGPTTCSYTFLSVYATESRGLRR